MKKEIDISQFITVNTLQKTQNDLVERIKQRRKEMKLSQKELAEKSGVGYSTIRRFETNGDIMLSSLLKIALALGCLDEFGTLFNKRVIRNLKDFEE